MTKKKVLVASLVTVLGISAVSYVAMNSSRSLGGVHGTECTHVGNHYLGKEATCVASGVKEFWACCECQQQFVEQPAVGTWTDKGVYDGVLASTHVAYIAPNDDHLFWEDGTCSRDGCTETMGNMLNLQPGLVSAPISLSAFGGWSAPLSISTLAGNHYFGTYDISKGMEFMFYVNYTTVSNSGFTMYLGNQYNEDGFILQYQTTRDDKYQFIYCRTNASDHGTILDGGFTTAHSVLLKTTQNHSDSATGSLFKITMTLLDPATSEYNINFDISRDDGATWGDKWLATEDGTAFTGFNYTFGAGYFASSHKVVRISNLNNDSAHVSNAVLSEYSASSATTCKVSYTSDDCVLGHTEYTVGAPVRAPEMKQEHHKFLGWYDENGHKFEDKQPAVAGNYNLTARYLLEKESAQTLSTVGLGSKSFDNTYQVEHYSAAVNPINEEYNMYFFMTPHMAAGDTYISFGMPYDFRDEKSRVEFRFELNTSQTFIRTYVSHKNTSMGTAGTAGTYNQDTSFEFVSDKVYLANLKFYHDGSTFVAYLGVQSMANGSMYERQMAFTFNDNPLASFDDIATRCTHYFVCVNFHGSASCDISTAW